MKAKLKFKGQLKTYILWPLLLSVLMVVMNAAVYTVDIRAGLWVSAFVFFYIVVALLIYFYNRPVLMTELITFATQYGQVQKQLLKELEIPYGLLDEGGKLIWGNRAFEEVVHRQNLYNRSVTTLLPAITKDRLPGETGESVLEFDFEERDYRAGMHRVSLRQTMRESGIVEAENYDGYLIALFLFDETEMKRYIRENDEQRIVIGLIYIDNYEEALESVEEVRRSLLTALIDRKINKYIASYDGIVKNMEKDKFLVVLDNKSLREMEENRIEILEDVKTVNIGNEMALTLSIGIGADAGSKAQGYEYARTAIDLALGRGGDQAVVKSPSQINYYGGKGKQVEKTTRVKARVKAHALREIVETKDNIIVMGHKIIDVDSFGAAVGIYIIARSLGKKAHIVVNEITSSIRLLIDGFMDNPDYEGDLFVNNEQAMEMVDSTAALVVVDVNKPSYTECKGLLSAVRSIVVLDHHRQGAEVIENATLSYIEPYASSACEMVAEILQYIDENIKIRPMEADCIYAGIMIDTNNFMTKTGVRTFEAAAFLKRNGADVTRVRKLFRDDMADYKARAETVRHAEVYRDYYAISKCPSAGLESPTIVGAQAANELLNINGMKASFVMTDYQNKIYISARSIDEINVQLIMERLGGGGHMNIAGAQLENISVDEAREIITHTIDVMTGEGALL